MWASRRTHWRMSPAAPPGRFFLKNHNSIWVTGSKREPFNRGGRRWTWQRLTASQRVQRICSRAQWQLHKRPLTRAARVSEPLMQHQRSSRLLSVSVLLNPEPTIGNRQWSHLATGRQVQSRPRRGAAFSCSNKVVSLQNQYDDTRNSCKWRAWFQNKGTRFRER